jgi:hypothetical protein
MLEILGKKYYIDVDEVIKICRPVYETNGSEEEKKEQLFNGAQIELNIFKFEILKACIERVLNDYEDLDEKLGEFAAEGSTSLSFKVAYNTLLKYNILIEDDDNYQ